MTNTNLTKHRIWAGLIGFLALVFATIVIYSASHPFEIIFRVEMDDNSVKVVQSMEKVYETNNENPKKEQKYNFTMNMTKFYEERRTNYQNYTICPC